MTITPITASEADAQTADSVAANLQTLRVLFPSAFTEGKVDFDILRQLLGCVVEDGDERYGLNWSGKRRARRLALQPSLGTLRPVKADSLDWDVTRNLFIEGDNLEVLKLLTKPYAGRVKLVYIDPPYNTGNDFVYPDDYADSIGQYLRRTGQISNSGIKATSNPESSGRYHTDWLNMMYPRLVLARGLMSKDGVILISCDDNEAPQLRQVMNEIFGEENFIAQFVWKARQFSDARATSNVSTDHEYILAYGKSGEVPLRGVARDESKFSNPDGDSRGEWMSRSILGLATREQRPNLHYDIVDSLTGRVFPPNPATGWRYSRDRMSELIGQGQILFPKKDEGRPREKKFRKDMTNEFIAFRSVIDGIHTADGTQEIRQIFDADIFAFPKPVSLLSSLIQQSASEGDIVIDFFAGSGTTGHAVMAQNGSDGCNRHFILVQLPEVLDPANKDQKAASEFCDSLGKPRTIAELTKERLRRAAAKVKAEHPDAKTDLGFRVYKLAASNLKAWQPRTDSTEALAADLAEAADNLLPGRTEDDLLVELLLKRGIDLAEPMLTRTVDNRTYNAFGGGVLVTYLGDVVAIEAEAVATAVADWIMEMNPVAPAVVFFRDIGFANDVAKANVDAILRQRLRDRGPGQPDLLEAVRSV